MTPKPKTPKPPPPPPSTPTRADASVVSAGTRASQPFASLISTGPSGLQRKANTSKSSLIGGS